MSLTDLLKPINIKEMTINIITSNEFNLEETIKKIQLDVVINKEKTAILQRNDESKIIAKVPKLLSNIDTSSGLGLVRASLAKHIDKNDKIRIYTSPSEFIPIGTYCDSCSNSGKLHKTNCPIPFITNVKLTFNGLKTYAKYIIREEASNQNLIDARKFINEFNISDVIMPMISLEISYLTAITIHKEYFELVGSTKEKKKHVIPSGFYCSLCSLVNNSEEPINHQQGCSAKFSNVFLTKKGLQIYKQTISFPNNEFTQKYYINSFIELYRNSPNNFVMSLIMKQKLLVNPDDNFSDTSIPYSEIVRITEKPAFFTGPILLVYKNFDNGSGTSIKIYSKESNDTILGSSNILFDNIPYKNTDSIIDYILIRIESAIEEPLKEPTKLLKSIFSTIVYKQQLNIKLFLDYLFSIKSKYLTMNPEIKDYMNSNFCYKIIEHKLTKNGYSVKFQLCFVQGSSITGDLMFSLMVFENSMQITVFDKEKINDNSDYEATKDKFINELLNMENFIHNYMEYFIKSLDDVDSFIIKRSNLEKIETILGSAKKPTKKSLLFTGSGFKDKIKNAKVILFNQDTMSWSSDIEYQIIDRSPIENNVILKNLTDGSLINIHENLIGLVDESKDTMCRVATGTKVVMRPEPFSFNGLCKSSKNQYIDPMGCQSRIDNRYYPCCKPLNKKNLEFLKRFLLDGYNDSEKIDNNISEIKSSKYSETLEQNKFIDAFAGTLSSLNSDPWSSIPISINDTIIVKTNHKNSHNGEWIPVKILAVKSNGLKNLEKETIYLVRSLSEGIEEEFEIDGSAFHPAYRNYRNFDGLNNIFNNDKKSIKDFILKCAEDLWIIEQRPLYNYVISHNYGSIEKLLNYIPIDKIFPRVRPLTTLNASELASDVFKVLIIPYKITLCLFIKISGDNILYVVDEYKRFMITSNNIYKKYRQLFRKYSGFGFEYMLGYVSHENNELYPLSEKAAGPDENYSGLINYVSLNKKPEQELVFFNDHDQVIYKWSVFQKIMHSVVVVVMDINKDLVKFGLINETKVSNKDDGSIEEIKKLEQYFNTSLKNLHIGSYVRININMMIPYNDADQKKNKVKKLQDKLNKNYIINEFEPILYPVITNADEYLGYIRTKLILEELLFHINFRKFEESKWIIGLAELQDDGYGRPLVLL